LRKRLFEGATDCDLNGEQTVALRLDAHGVLRTLANYARAIHYHEFGSKWLSPIQVHSPAIYGEGVTPRHEVVALCYGFKEAFLQNVEEKGENPEIFKYQAMKDFEELLTVIRMVFYGGCEVFTFSGRNTTSGETP
jgi:hypothetical protein